MFPPRTCDEAKAIFRTHLYHRPWHSSQTTIKIYLPLKECEQNKDEIALLNKIGLCLDRMDLHNKNDSSCDQLLKEFNNRFCFTKEVDEETQKIVDYIEGMGS